MNFSSFSAVSELFVTAGVLYVVINNIKGKHFPVRLVVGIAVFEFCVNMLYMIYRMQQGPAAKLQGYLLTFAAVHGSLSLIVFIAFIVFSVLAYFDYRRGRFYFKEHKVLSVIFIFFWMVSVLSGEVLYFLKPS